MVIRGHLLSRSNREAHGRMNRLIALLGDKNAHKEGNQTCLSHKSCLSCFCLSPQSRTSVLPDSEKMHVFFCETPQLDNCCYNSLLYASEVLMLAALFACLAGCFSSRGCDFSHCTHQSWENASCSGSKNHSPSCSRYDVKPGCEGIAYWLQISMLLSFMRGYQEQKGLLPALLLEICKSLPKILRHMTLNIWKSVWTSNLCVNLGPTLSNG